MSHRDERSYVFGPFRLDCGERVLYRGNTPVALPPKAIQVLLCLVSNPRRVVDKDELLRMVWPDTFVEEGNLREQIFQIRRVLGDQNGVAYIETVPKRGYRFNADVQELRRGAKTNRNQRLAFLLTAVVLACLGIAVLLGRRPIRALRARGIELKPLTSYPGPELFPAISPDGDRVAFTWTGLSNDQIDLYARPINADAPVRLTYDRAVECYPTWSPDGTLIAFMQCDGNMGTIHTEAEVYVVGSSGGPKTAGRTSIAAGIRQREFPGMDARRQAFGCAKPFDPGGSDRTVLVRHRDWRAPTADEPARKSRRRLARSCAGRPHARLRSPDRHRPRRYLRAGSRGRRRSGPTDHPRVDSRQRDRLGVSDRTRVLG
jgi:DNA-binding winged helix-turn-helix (wHTH) protein